MNCLPLKAALVGGDVKPAAGEGIGLDSSWIDQPNAGDAHVNIGGMTGLLHDLEVGWRQVGNWLIA
jgi:hypothetical protein